MTEKNKEEIYKNCENLASHDIEEEIKLLKVLANEYKKSLIIYIWTDNMIFVDYDDIHIIKKDNKKWFRLIRNNNASLSSTLVPLDKVQAIKIELPKTDEYSFLKQSIEDSLLSAQQTSTKNSQPITEQSKQSYI